MTTKQFNKLSREKKKVLVVQDVLAQISAKKYESEKGAYLIPTFIKEINKSDQINECFDNISSCRVCALGSFMLSSTHLGNHLTFEDINIQSQYHVDVKLNSENVKELFLSIFEAKELLLIEMAFEGFPYWLLGSSNKKNYVFKMNNVLRYGADYLGQTLNYEEALACQKFFQKYKTDKNRLVAICNNIIKNKTFTLN